MLEELSIKGGGNDPVFEDGQTNVVAESAVGKQMTDGRLFFRDVDKSNVTMSVREFIPPGGWLPVYHYSRGENVLDGAFV